MDYLNCKHCGATLWSFYAKRLGVCCECETPDREEPQDLEERLDKALTE